MLSATSTTCAGATFSAGTAIGFTSPFGFGSGVGIGGNSILLQPGFYNVHLSADRFQFSSIPGGDPGVKISLTGGFANFFNDPWFVNTPDGVTGALGGDRLVQVLAANTTIQFIPINATIQFNDLCSLVITQIQ